MSVTLGHCRVVLWKAKDCSQTLFAVLTSLITACSQRRTLDWMSHALLPDALAANRRRCSQLEYELTRTGFSSAMGDYLHRINRVPSPLCPECSAEDHTVLHLFSCAAHPTDLCPTDLWERPREVAPFLSSLPTFAHLPALPPPPPEPPPPPDQPSPDSPPPPWHGPA